MSIVNFMDNKARETLYGKIAFGIAGFIRDNCKTKSLGDTIITLTGEDNAIVAVIRLNNIKIHMFIHDGAIHLRQSENLTDAAFRSTETAKWHWKVMLADPESFEKTTSKIVEQLTGN